MATARLLADESRWFHTYNVKHKQRDNGGEDGESDDGAYVDAWFVLICTNNSDDKDSYNIDGDVMMNGISDDTMTTMMVIPIIIIISITRDAITATI